MVVCVESHRSGTERAHEPLDDVDSGRIGAGPRRQEPGRAVEQLGCGPVGPPCRRPRPGDRARSGVVRSRRRAPRFVERDVGHRRVRQGLRRAPRAPSTRRSRPEPRQRPARRRDGVRDGARASNLPRAGRLPEARLIGVERLHRRRSRPPRRKADGGADEPGADDREPFDTGVPARGRLVPARSPGSSCFITSSTAVKIAAACSDSGPSFAARASRSSSPLVSRRSSGTRSRSCARTCADELEPAVEPVEQRAVDRAISARSAASLGARVAHR